MQLAREVFLEGIGEKPKAYDPAREAAAVTPKFPAKPETPKDPAAVSLGRKGGLKGGPARAAKLSAEERSEIGKKAAAKRWGKGEIKGKGST